MEMETKKETSSRAGKHVDEVKSKKGKPFSLKFYHGNLDLSSSKVEKCLGIPEKVCARCGKIFVPAPYHRYKQNGKWYCSYPCDLHRNDDQDDPVLNGKPVDQFTKSGIYLATFKSAVEAAKSVDVKPNAIRLCCTGKTKTSAGFVWRYREEKAND